MNLRQILSMRRWNSLLGWPGAIGGAGMGVCLALYFMAMQPAQQRLNAVRISAISLHDGLTRAGRGASKPALSLDEQLDGFYRSFPGEHEATDWIGMIAAIARRDGLVLQQADYKVTHEKIGKLTRIQMNLPLTGEYQTIRKFLTDLRAEVPIVSLEQVQFERQKVGDPQVDARLRLIIFMGHAS